MLQLLQVDARQTQGISRLLREMQTQLANLENGVSEEARNPTKLLAGLRWDFKKNFLRRRFGPFFRLYDKRRDDSVD